MSNRTNKKAPDNRGNNEEKELEMLLRSIWLGMRDSNPRMHGPKPCALPLGQSPITRLIITQKGFELLIQGILVTISVKLVSAESRSHSATPSPPL